MSCPIARCPARDGPTRFARASGQGRYKRRPVGGYLSVGRVPSTRGPKRTGPTPWTPSNIGGGADALVCSALSCASCSASTALICSSSNSSRSSSRQTCALRCWGDGHRQSGAHPAALADRDATAHTRCALREEQSRSDVLDPFHDQHLALPANPAAVFIFRRRRPNHGADPRFTALVASSARSKVSPSILSVLARRRRREVAIEAASTTWLSIPSLSKTR